MANESPMLTTLRRLHERCAAGTPPTTRELAADLGVTQTGAHWRLEEMESRGWTTRRRGIPRSWRVTDKGLAKLGLSEDEPARLRQRIRELERIVVQQEQQIANLTEAA